MYRQLVCFLIAFTVSPLVVMNSLVCHRQYGRVIMYMLAADKCICCHEG